MRASASLLGLTLILGVAISCKLSERFAGDKNAGTVSELWADVPPFPGATKIEAEIPLGVRLLMRGMIQGKVNFISFRSDKSPEEVRDFYSNERMKAAGWAPTDKGCSSDADDEKHYGVICLFSRNTAGKEERLAILVAQDEEAPETNLFYARIDATNVK
jgi:hypothetical protein